MGKTADPPGRPQWSSLESEASCKTHWSSTRTTHPTSRMRVAASRSPGAMEPAKWQDYETRPRSDDGPVQLGPHASAAGKSKQKATASMALAQSLFFCREEENQKRHKAKGLESCCETVLNFAGLENDFHLADGERLQTTGPLAMAARGLMSVPSCTRLPSPPPKGSPSWPVRSLRRLLWPGRRALPDQPSAF